MNFKHGFYSNNPDLNPDSIMMKDSQLQIKQWIKEFQPSLCNLVDSKPMRAGEADICIHLLDLILPQQPHFLPESHHDKLVAFHQSETFPRWLRIAQADTLENCVKRYREIHGSL